VLAALGAGRCGEDEAAPRVGPGDGWRAVGAAPGDEWGEDEGTRRRVPHARFLSIGGGRGRHDAALGEQRPLWVVLRRHTW